MYIYFSQNKQKPHSLLLKAETAIKAINYEKQIAFTFRTQKWTSFFSL